MKLRIIHKGLLLLLLPFVLESALFGFLIILNEKAEQIAAEERLRTKYMRIMTALLEDSGVAWADMLNKMTSLRGTNHGPSLTPLQYRTNTEEQLRQLKAIPTKSARLDQALQKVIELRNVQADTLDALDQNTDAFADIVKLQELKNRTRLLRTSLHISRDYLAHVKNILQTEQNLSDAALADERFQRALVMKLLIVGFIVQVVLTIASLLLFLNNITRRLDYLVDNARKLPSGAQLEHRVTGADEIAYLDDVLHDASSRLEEASQNRQSIMNMIAHDIRSPLMSSTLLLEKLSNEIKASPDSMVNGGQSLPPGQETTNRLKNTFQQLCLLVEDLLAIDKHDSGTLELNLGMFDLKTLIDETVELARPQAERRNITIVSSVPSMEVVADRNRILQVINNLLTNAVKFSNSDGQIEISGKASKSDVTVRVRDYGKGIHPKELPFVFDKFYQASNSSNAKSAQVDGSSQGFGLGLAISKMIITSHGGNLGVDSQPGKGSTFWFSLPVDGDV